MTVLTAAGISGAVDITTNIIVPILTVIFGGGWLINYRQKKALEQAQASKAEVDVMSDKVDLTSQLFEKYQATVLSAMGDHDEKQRDIEKRLDTLSKELEGYFSSSKIWRTGVSSALSSVESRQKANELMIRRVELKLLLATPALQQKPSIVKKYKEYVALGGNDYITELYNGYISETKKIKKANKPIG